MIDWTWTIYEQCGIFREEVAAAVHKAVMDSLLTYSFISFFFGLLLGSLLIYYYLKKTWRK